MAHARPLQSYQCAVVPVIVNQTMFKIAEIVQRFRFLVNAFDEILINRKGGFGVFQPVFRLSQQDVASAAGDQTMFLSWIQFQCL